MIVSYIFYIVSIWVFPLKRWINYILSPNFFQLSHFIIISFFYVDQQLSQ